MINERQLLTALLKVLSAGWVAPSHFERMAVDLKIKDGGPRIFFLTGIQQVIRELPFKVFDDDNARLAVIEAVQSALDAAIAREEETLESEAQATKPPIDPERNGPCVG